MEWWRSSRSNGGKSLEFRVRVESLRLKTRTRSSQLKPKPPIVSANAIDTLTDDDSLPFLVLCILFRQEVR
jgi:hypothetical protein